MALVKGDQPFWKVAGRKPSARFLMFVLLDISLVQFTAAGTRLFSHSLFRDGGAGGEQAVLGGLQHGRRGGDEEPP